MGRAGPGLPASLLPTDSDRVTVLPVPGGATIGIALLARFGSAVILWRHQDCGPQYSTVELVPSTSTNLESFSALRALRHPDHVGRELQPCGGPLQPGQVVVEAGDTAARHGTQVLRPIR